MSARRSTSLNATRPLAIMFLAILSLLQMTGAPGPTYMAAAVLLSWPALTWWKAFRPQGSGPMGPL